MARILLDILPTHVMREFQGEALAMVGKWVQLFGTNPDPAPAWLMNEFTIAQVELFSMAYFSRASETGETHIPPRPIERGVLEFCGLPVFPYNFMGPCNSLHCQIIPRDLAIKLVGAIPIGL